MPSFNPPSQSNDWLIQVPISALVALQGLPDEMEKLRAENRQLRRELDGLRIIQNQTIERIAEIRDFIRRQP